MSKLNSTYHSYLLRLWQDSPQAVWRASAQSIQTNEIMHFADLDALFTFLWQQTVMNLTVEQTSIIRSEHPNS